MKNFLLLALISCGLSFCSRVTTRPDKTSATSGTMGSVKVTDEPPRRIVVVDTLTMADSIRRAADSLP